MRNIDSSLCTHIFTFLMYGNELHHNCIFPLQMFGIYLWETQG